MKRPTAARRVTLREVAERCGVSGAAASMALNRPPERCPLKPETRDRILAVAAELGYRADRRAQVLATGRSNMVGWFSPWALPLIKGHGGELLQGLVAGLWEDARQLTFVPVRPQEDRWRATLADASLDAAVVASRTSVEVQEALRASHLPAVFINEHGSGEEPRVCPDDVDGVRLAVEHLLACGHRRIGWLGPPRGDRAHYSVALREDAFAHECSRLGLEAAPRWHEPPEAAVARLSAPDAPDAVVVYADDLAVALQAALRRRGVPDTRMPALLCFNDDPILDQLPVPMTCIAIPFQRLGREAAAVVAELLTTGRAASRTVPVELKVRASTGG
jgi:LacI family transcriptional regulator